MPPWSHVVHMIDDLLLQRCQLVTFARERGQQRGQQRDRREWRPQMHNGRKIKLTGWHSMVAGDDRPETFHGIGDWK